MSAVFYAMIDKDTDRVEDLLWMTDHGCYRREQEDWEPLDHELDDDEFEGLWALDVSKDAAEDYDAAVRTKAKLTVQDIAEYAKNKADLDTVSLYKKSDKPKEEPEPVTASGEAPNLRGVYAGLTWEETVQPSAPVRTW